MRLFLYYSLHSLFNQLRKLFKTWVLVFIIVCGLIGGLIGFGAATLEDAAGPSDDPYAEIDFPEEDMPEEEFDMWGELGITAGDGLELAAGAIILIVFASQAISADKNGSKIFLPADVNLLFSAPLKPQSVLLFRLGTQIGTMLAGSLYLLFQIPNLVHNVGFDLWTVLAIFAAWFMTLIIGKFLQILVYTVTSTYVEHKKKIIYGIYAFLALIAAAFFVYAKSSDEGILAAAVSFFNAPFTRWIPFWGWIKAFCVSAFEGNITGVLLYSLLTIAGSVLLVYGIWNVKADFYEDAMAKSEEIAEMMDAMQSEGRSFMIKRSKDRSERIIRDGLRHGSGADVFFFKTMYNRWRFAFLHVFTKTSGTYLFAALIISLFMRFIVESTSLVPMGIVLAVICFFRSLGNPLNQDLRTDAFRMVPESTWMKLFWSLLGGSVSCLLDLMPSVILGTMFTGGSLIEALAWIPAIVSIDFYATTIGTFLDVSIPESIGKTIKQVIQIMFLYFGLLPDAALIAVGLTFNHPYLAVLAACIVNIYLGLVFFSISPVFIEPQGDRKYHEDLTRFTDTRKAKNAFSRTGISLCGLLIAATGMQMALIKLPLPQGISPQAVIWLSWLKTFMPIYLFGVPVMYLIIRKLPAVEIEKKNLKLKQWLVLPIICIFLMYAGNIIGSLITTILGAIFHTGGMNPIDSMISSGSVWTTIVFAVILAPVMEELVFRKLLIDRVHVYGEKTAILVSAFTFGLFHGNFAQFFYAAALGALFAYVYVRTGKVRYTIVLHMFVNFFGGVVGPQLTQKAILSLPTLNQMKNASVSDFLTPQVILFAVYLVVLLGCIFAGFAALVIEGSTAYTEYSEQELPKKGRFSIVWLNAGMLVFVLGCVGLFVFSFI